MRNKKAKSEGTSPTGEGSREFKEHGDKGQGLINDDRTNPGSRVNSPSEAKSADWSDSGSGMDNEETTMEETLHDRIKE